MFDENLPVPVIINVTENLKINMVISLNWPNTGTGYKKSPIIRPDIRCIPTKN
jgi:hypothetical protein